MRGHCSQLRIRAGEWLTLLLKKQNTLWLQNTDLETSSPLANLHRAERYYKYSQRGKGLVNVLTQSHLPAATPTASHDVLALWCNGGVTVTGVTSHFYFFKLDLRPTPQKGIHASYCNPIKKPTSGEVTGHGREPMLCYLVLSTLVTDFFYAAKPCRYW